ncbi:MAG: oxalate:formate antiporter [delta proteobacterium ML8_F1]|nr:MAG: oxalate:formate antiporter [delta proteobacterium ML8_F1]
MEKKARRVLVAATGINLVSGMLYTWAIVSRVLISEMGWTNRQASLPYTLATIGFVIAMMIFGRIQDTRGPRFTATIGVALVGSGLFLSGLVPEPFFVALGFGVLTGLGIGTLNVSTMPPALKWFPKEKKGMVGGVVVAGVSLSSMVYAPLADWLTRTYGVSTFFIVVGMISFGVSMVLAQFLSNPPGLELSAAQVRPDAGEYGKEFTWQEMVRTPKFWTVWLMFGLSSSAGLMVIGHIVSIASVQAAWEGGFLLVMLLALLNTFGRFAGGSLSDKVGRINLIRGLFVLSALNMLAFSSYVTVPLLALGVAIAGMCYGAAFSVFPAVVSDLYGNQNFGANYGIMFSSWGVGGTIGPMTAAWIYDMTGGFVQAYRVSALLLLTGFVVTFLFAGLKLPESQSLEEGTLMDP